MVGIKRIVGSSFAALVLAGSASAGFIGLDIREDKDMTGAPAGVRTFNFYVQFDGNGLTDRVLSVGQPDEFAGFGIWKERQPNADFYQELTPVLGIPNDIAPAAAFFPLSPSYAFDSYVDIGLKTFTTTDDTQVDPDFGFVDTDGSGGDDVIRGGWFNSNPPGLQGAADGNQEVFIMQLSITGLEAGAEIGHRIGSLHRWDSDIFIGGLTIFRQGDVAGGENPAVGTRIIFYPVAPGSVVMFGIAGVVGMRRRR